MDVKITSYEVITVAASKGWVNSWRAKHQLEQPGCQCADCKSTIQNVNGVEFIVREDGTVSWAQDWIVLFDLAYSKQFGLDTKSYGPGTYGHVDVIAGPWEHTANLDGVICRLREA